MNYGLVLFPFAIKIVIFLNYFPLNPALTLLSQTSISYEVVGTRHIYYVQHFILYPPTLSRSDKSLISSTYILVTLKKDFGKHGIFVLVNKSVFEILSSLAESFPKYSVIFLLFFL